MSDTIEAQGRNIASRLQFIEWRLFWEGQINRSDLEKRFGVSTPQASVDFRHYKELASENIEYNPTLKRYVASKDMKPRFLRISANSLLLQLRALANGVLKRENVWFSEIPAADVAPEVSRDVRTRVLRRVLEAIRTRQALRVEYLSLTSSRRRDIAPHAIAFDGHRWHARAWCCERKEFRDFVLTRIKRLGKLKPVTYDPDHDFEWNRSIKLRLCPHPGLSAEQSQAIQRDYSMREGAREIEIRLSLAYYFIKRMNLDLEELEPVRAQIRLANRREVEAALKDARNASRRAVEAET